MLKQVMSLIGWILAILCFNSALGALTFGIITIRILPLLIYSLIFLPPLCRVTGRYGLTKNILARIVLFILTAFVSQFVFGSSSQTETQPLPQPTSTNTVHFNTQTAIFLLTASTRVV